MDQCGLDGHEHFTVYNANFTAHLYIFNYYYIFNIKIYIFYFL